MSAGTSIARGVVSASMALVATQAMAAAAKDSERTISLVEESSAHELQARMDAAVAKRDVKVAVSEAFSLLAGRFGKDDVSLTARYFPGVQLAATTSNSRDFTEPAPGCYSNCHSACHANCHTACHNACHGSRSWR